MIAVIFEVYPAAGRKHEYLDLAAALRPELEALEADEGARKVIVGSALFRGGAIDVAQVTLREKGDDEAQSYDEDYLRAERTARASLALRTQRNDAASVVLASAVTTQFLPLRFAL